MGPLISVRDLNKTYSIPGRNLHILKGISFDVQRGELAALMALPG